MLIATPEFFEVPHLNFCLKNKYITPHSSYIWANSSSIYIIRGFHFHLFTPSNDIPSQLYLKKKETTGRISASFTPSHHDKPCPSFIAPTQ